MRSPFAVAAGLSIILGGPALADDCKPLSLVTSLDIRTLHDDRQIFVPITLAGHDGYMLVDTGSWISGITEGWTDKLGLVRQRGLFGSMNVSGQEMLDNVQVAAKLGRIQGSDFNLQVWPGKWSDPDFPVFGMLGSDILQKFDVDVDVAAKKVNLMNQDHCPGKVIYWPFKAVAVVPFTLMYDGKIQFNVLLDGRTVVAVLDTGASRSTLSQIVAEGPFGLALGSADTPQTGTLTDRPGSKTYEHVFKTLDFEGVAISNPKLEILPDLFHSENEVESTSYVDTRLTDPRANSKDRAMLIGMDIMRHFHFYIAYKEEKIYITPADAPHPARAEAGSKPLPNSSATPAH